MNCTLVRAPQGQVLEFSLLLAILLYHMPHFMRHLFYGGSGDMNNFENELKLKHEDDFR